MVGWGENCEIGALAFQIDSNVSDLKSCRNVMRSLQIVADAVQHVQGGQICQARAFLRFYWTCLTTCLP